MFIKFIFTSVILFASLTVSYSQNSLPGEEVSADYSKKIAPDSKTTYLDLLRSIFPDADNQGNAKTSIDIKNSIDGEEGAQSYEGAMHIESADLHWVATATGKRLMLVIRVTSEKDIGFTWGELNLMALYSGGSEPKLLDVVDASGDRQSYHWGNLRVHPKMDVIVFEYQRFNAGENFDGFSFTYVEKDKFRVLFDDFPYLYYGRPCETELSETGAISMGVRARSGYRDLVFTVKMSRQKFRDDCETPRSKKMVRNFRLTATWRNGRYRFADGGAEIKRLNREEKRYGFGG